MQKKNLVFFMLIFLVVAIPQVLAAGKIKISTIPTNAVWFSDGSTQYTVQVRADSTDIPTIKIKSAEWDLTVPSALLPYITHTSSSLPSTANPSTNPDDFFYNQLMLSSYNRVDTSMVSGELDDNVRGKAASATGVANKEGLLGSYTFTLAPEAPQGDYTFGLHSIYFYDSAGKSYTSIGGRNTSTMIVTNQPFTVINPINTSQYVLHLEEMPEYNNEQPHYTGAAVAQMILNYIRNGVGYSSLNQDEIYSYGYQYNLAENNINNSNNSSGLLELDARGMDAVLGHYDPYDQIVNGSFYDYFDFLSDGNPWQGYNYEAETYSDVQEYMTDIVNWMSYEVTINPWTYKDGQLVAEPNTPAAVPIYGSYTWVAVNGFSVSEEPAWDLSGYPTPLLNYAVNGFFLTDPRTEGIGGHVYVTADEAINVYFLPLNTSDGYNGKFVQIAEPPAIDEKEKPELRPMKAEIKKPKADFSNLETMQAMAADEDAAPSTGKTIKKEIKQKTWQSLVDPSLLQYEEAVKVFSSSKMKSPILVKNMDGDKEYYLVEFAQKSKTTGVIMLDAKDGSFKQATWTNQPKKDYIISKKDALKLIGLDNAKKVKGELVWEVGMSESPFYPVWKITQGSDVWFVTQSGKVTRA